MMDFLKLIRYQNLLILILMQVVLRYGFIEFQPIVPALAHWQFILLVFATVCIAAGGYIINDVYDQDTDRVNKPQKMIVGHRISENMANKYYFLLNIIGVGAGFYLANIIGKPGFAMIFIVSAFLLYLYAASLKQSLLAGNFVVAFLVFASVMTVGLFDLYPILTIENRPLLGLVFGVILDYAIFAFIVNFLREIVKDCEDVNGDYNQGMNTLPIAMGVGRTAKLVFWLSFIPTGLVLFYINQYFISAQLYPAVVYALIFVAAPLIYFTVKMWEAKNKKDFSHLSMVLKLIMFFGILSLLIVSLNIRNNA